ncbi:uncharacterized protein LODBEIA_P48630 [Lodderomyces beijingensis]|uniref:Uncharacterized protein n=1 Tax=Lodderomyces beijingensis TaxID=1775926 RepID=A0ABP0ZRV7_9ASCO
MPGSIYTYIDESLTHLDEKLEEESAKISKQVPPFYRRILFHPALRNWVKWSLLFSIFRVQNPIQWANFLSLNKPIRELLHHYHRILMKLLWFSPNDKSRFQAFIQHFSNFITCTFLYFATVRNNQVPKDYFIVELFSGYYGDLNPPSKSQILVEPRLSKFLKLSTYKQTKWYNLVKTGYDHKEYVIFPILFAQILSNYLTPTKYKLNQRYLSPFIKRNILNPIWINFSMGINYNRMNWVNLATTYLLQNLVLSLVVAGYNFKELILDKFYEIKFGKRSKQDEVGIIENFVAYCFHRSNAILNFIYCPNLISIFLLAVTAPVLRLINPIRGRKPANALQSYYIRNSKSFFKTYTKLVGFTAALATLGLNSLNLVPDLWFDKTLAQKIRLEEEEKQAYDDEENEENKEEKAPIRLISKGFLNALDLYLFRVILLSKWRIVKSNHPFFKQVKLSWYNKIETALMCIGFFKYMNLNNFIHGKRSVEKDRISGNSTMRAANFVMQ